MNEVINKDVKYIYKSIKSLLNLAFFLMLIIILYSVIALIYFDDAMDMRCRYINTLEIDNTQTRLCSLDYRNGRYECDNKNNTIQCLPE